MATIRIENVRKSFGAVKALDDVVLDIADQEFVVLLGASGCGKTTLLRIVAGLETQSAGRVLIDGRDVSALPPRARGLAMVFQNYAVFPHMTVFENIAFGLRNQKAPEDRIRAQVGEAAELMHIEALLERYPAQLSGGQRQRVAVARALAVKPAVLLMDEPLSNLDALLRLEMRAELKSVLQRSRTTTIYVTHDQTEAMSLADRIAVMHGGAIVQCDRPMVVYARPRTTFVGGFIGSPPMNFLKANAQGGRVALGALALACPRADGPVTLGLRGEDMTPGDAPGLPAQVQVVEPLGPHLLLTARHDGQMLRIVAPPQLAVRGGDTIQLHPRADAVRWFDPATGIALS